MKNPSAFLSHSSADAEMAGRLAKDLRDKGIDVWYAEWEIKAGDSLRRKIDEGIDRASHFLVLLSGNSLKSEWVQTELDAGMVKRISGACRLIPILLGIKDDDVAATLRGIVWVRLDPYEDGLRKLIEACYEVATKPPLGTAPVWTQERPLTEIGLSTHAQRLAVLLNERSETGMALDPMLSAQEVLQALALNEDEVAIAADELEERGLAKLHKTLGMGNAGFSRISPTPYLFFETDFYLRGWDTEADARVLASVIVNRNKDVVSLSEADSALSWGPRRLNPAAEYLAAYGYAKPLATLGSAPYIYSGFIVTPKTKRFATQG